MSCSFSRASIDQVQKRTPHRGTSNWTTHSWVCFPLPLAFLKTTIKIRTLLFQASMLRSRWSQGWKVARKHWRKSRWFSWERTASENRSWWVGLRCGRVTSGLDTWNSSKFKCRKPWPNSRKSSSVTTTWFLTSAGSCSRCLLLFTFFRTSDVTSLVSDSNLVSAFELRQDVQLLQVVVCDGGRVHYDGTRQENKCLRHPDRPLRMSSWRHTRERNQNIHMYEPE